MPPIASNFPRRNRLIAGVTQGTLVVEAALKSGSLITARLAVEAGREVFAIPGSIHSELSRGCHQLIQQGAKLVESVDDILPELRLAGAAPRKARMGDRQASLFATPPPEAGSPDAELLDALGHDPVSFDALSARTGWPSDRLAAQLLELELAGRVRRLPGGLLQRAGMA
jgi:DNA processing protein